MPDAWAGEGDLLWKQVRDERVQRSKERGSMRRTIMNVVAIASLCLLASVLAAEAQQPDATLTVHTVSIAVGAGYSWGGGIVTFQGHEYPCRIDGLAVGAVGISSADAIGNVYHLAVAWDCPRPSPCATRARAARPPRTWGGTSGSCATTVAIRPSAASNRPARS